MLVFFRLFLLCVMNSARSSPNCKWNVIPRLRGNKARQDARTSSRFLPHASPLELFLDLNAFSTEFAFCTPSFLQHLEMALLAPCDFLVTVVRVTIDWVLTLPGFNFHRRPLNWCYYCPHFKGKVWGPRKVKSNVTSLMVAQMTSGLRQSDSRAHTLHHSVVYITKVHAGLSRAEGISSTKCASHTS